VALPWGRKEAAKCGGRKGKGWVEGIRGKKNAYKEYYV
jgi:hypothetical protein